MAKLATVETLWEELSDLPDEGHWRYCPGCGLGVAQASVARAIKQLELNPRRVVTFGGSGCYAPMGEQLGLSGYHGPHGRAVAVAVGVKLARPELTVLNLQGDGDSLAIGGNHFIHAARRNIDITVCVFNNFGYGDTGGNAGPMTPHGAITETSPYGSPEEPFDLCELAKGAGATYVARTTSYHAALTTSLIAKAISHKGFSVVEVLINCFELYGKRNGNMDAVSMFEWFRDKSVRVEQARNMKPDELKGKWVLGELHKDTAKPEFSEVYEEMVRRAQAQPVSFR